jgi:hypothetical protein
LSLQARLGLQKDDGFAKKSSWITVKAPILTIPVRIDIHALK